MPNLTLIHPQPHHIAIVGVGPKGLYTLEVLLAHLNAQVIQTPVCIHLFNRSKYFGAGDIYDVEQPHYLVMNYHTRYIQMWRDSEPKAVVEKPLPLAEWLKQKQFNSDFPRDYVPRAVVGEYLWEGYQALVQAAPSNVEILTYQTEVIDIESVGERFSIATQQQKLAYDFQQVVLTTGHPRPHPNQERQQYQQFCATRPASSYVDFVYPVTKRLAHIQANERVLIKGLGLTFIDTVLALTEGRGGTFDTDRNGQLRYQPSGKEPCCLYPFSRSGLPMIPRHEPEQTHLPELRYFTPEMVKKLAQQSTPINFETQILPLVEQDVLVAYYEKLMYSHGIHLHHSTDFLQVEQQIQQFHQTHPEEPVFNLDTLLNEAGNYFVMECLNRYIEVAEKGTEQHPLAAASAVWRAVSSGFNELYSFGRLTAESQQLFHRKYAGHFNRTAYGPPLLNMRKIKALAEAGFIDFSFARSPQVLLDQETGEFLVQKDTQAVSAQHVVDARIPKVDLTHTHSPLYRNLQKRGIIQLFENKTATVPFVPGCLHLNKNGHPIQADGTIETRILVYGTPTEGITYDNDTLSRTRNDFASRWAAQVAQDISEQQTLIPSQSTT